ncbi:hypothetical protein [Jatrophihabitans lederbergiae]|uniref:DUF2399 domain-containing protein n=1 Tax=Jatrophihabitans lederbergiae TaxID=3075547 RepID=A0ABU2JGB3_9ACTN|nr:hypothetical protein [Jatrophihabitans sp. DSM 44399]MDT0263977.1 hypothetical protein [Jatrophihabitans sp. DSM 44399]
MAALTEEHPATLRGTYYRVVSAGAVEKTEAGYRLVGRQVLKLRRSGVLPYSWITDGTRWIVKPTTWSDLDMMLADSAASYRRMLWRSQAVEVHLFTEKDAISGVIDGVTSRWDVPLGVLRGYSSESFCWSVAETLALTEKPVHIYQLGDHDPSGIDAWRDFCDKVARFAPTADVTFSRIAVLPEQIEAWNLPTRPTKRTDTRAAGFTGGSVEVDAIPPSQLRRLVEDAIVQHIDPHQLGITRMVEDAERSLLQAMIGDRA